MTRFLFTALFAMSVIAASAQVTPHGWRGPARDGIYPETALLKQWPAEGPALKWEVMDAGKGYSSPVVVGDRVYITGMSDDQSMEIFTAYTLDGKKLYSVPYSKPWDGQYPETRTTPTIDNGKAYLISGAGQVVCLSTADGKILWSVDGAKQYSRKTGNWGTSECALVFDNKVIYTPAGDLTTMVALDKNTGKEIWRSKALGDPSTYLSPLLIEYKGRRQIVGATANNMIGVNPDTGAIEWQYTIEPKTKASWANIAPNTPLFKDGKLFYSHGYDIFSFMLEIADDMKSVKLVWHNGDMDTQHGGYVLLDGTIYGTSHDRVSSAWVALDWATGKTLYADLWANKSAGVVISADGMLYCYSERTGDVALVKPSREKFEVISQFRITKGSGPHWAHPVIKDGVMYLRHGEALMAYKIK
ncbi:MAG: PQQ-like beta-propeller repeat protein [Alistipes sp.]|nr:PQQ-like beta-propeller repeat protein [Alistipes sp.]